MLGMKENLVVEDYQRIVEECLVEIGVNEFFLQFISCEIRRKKSYSSDLSLTFLSITVGKNTLLSELRVPSFAANADAAKSITMNHLRQRLSSDRIEEIVVSGVM